MTKNELRALISESAESAFNASTEFLVKRISEKYGDSVPTQNLVSESRLATHLFFVDAMYKVLSRILDLPDEDSF